MNCADDPMRSLKQLRDQAIRLRRAIALLRADVSNEQVHAVLLECPEDMLAEIEAEIQNLEQRRDS